mmetsp:Transcript_135285/g.320656  ORF Transcript_135285/g.320656 Transcript_135285/m.320656 type:complete len:107 (+) Transcript_135285:259-579(+)
MSSAKLRWASSSDSKKNFCELPSFRTDATLQLMEAEGLYEDSERLGKSGLHRPRLLLIGISPKTTCFNDLSDISPSTNMSESMESTPCFRTDCFDTDPSSDQSLPK